MLATIKTSGFGIRGRGPKTPYGQERTVATASCFPEHAPNVCRRLFFTPMTSHIRISVSHQTLHLHDGQGARAYRISTATNGVGCEAGSFRTPRGLHRVRLKIGEGCPSKTVFVGRRPTGEILSEELQQQWPERDWILSRILWLDGLVTSLNRGGSVDTLRRYIYIHGTADEQKLGVPSSHGCIRMANADVIDLFGLVSIGSLVTVED